ncbi:MULTISPECIES: type II TA system antitoxin MqsA family protein [unclassified Mesotoga]|uniref:type II TA system antitoxin MqsA family protein n=1 Tax=unclassified Mesotoga TaxID=1184398 RepID=UPI000DA6BFCF|nr:MULTISPECIES: type II TA system antitoxin MqsA family protein [unclassified Mesotoga]PZC53109.1 hypothetical protein LH53_00825 [Mesotoga sp. TolDC]
MICPECGKKMRLSREESVESFKGSQVRLSYDVYRCDECGNSYVDARSLDEAWKKIWDDYEKTNCIPSPSDLRKARENLNLTQEEIALLLGRTKSLVSKLEDGSRALSDKLLESYTNYIMPGGEDFISFVNAAAVQGRISPDDRDRIVGKTGIGNESRLSLRERMIIEAHGNTETLLNGFKVFSGRTLSAVVGRFLSEIGPLDHMKLFKLLFYSDSLSFERRGMSITGLRYIANHYGPTPVKYEDVVSYLKEAGVVEEGKKAYVMVKGTAMPDHLPNEEEEIIKTIVKRYGRLTSTKLSSLSHEEPCWKETGEKKVIRYCKGMIRNLSRLNEQMNGADS